jgi:predicted DNA-binding transcriptional regulator YafY
MSHCGQFLSSIAVILKIMANTSSRTLRLLSLLQNHRFWPGTDLAERLGVSPRTLRRDVDRLRDLGYPVEAHRGVDGGYQLAAGAALPPLVVDDEEAVPVRPPHHRHLTGQL